MKKAEIDGTTILLISILIIAVGLLIYTIPSTIDLFKNKNEQQISVNTPVRMSRMTLTGFDKQLALEFMDKNHDGRCDVCGMPVEQCIDSGQMQCNMDSKSTIGILGSAHVHADFKMYIDGKPMNFADTNYYMKSSFLHLDDNQNKEDASGVLHMHATGVPLWVFFKSIGIDFNKDCITFDNEKYCNNGNKKLGFFVNGKESNEFENYAFNDLDKILISYGDESEEEVKNQLNSITSSAALH